MHKKNPADNSAGYFVDIKFETSDFFKKQGIILRFGLGFY